MLSINKIDAVLRQAREVAPQRPVHELLQQVGRALSAMPASPGEQIAATLERQGLVSHAAHAVVVELVALVKEVGMAQLVRRAVHAPLLGATLGSGLPTLTRERSGFLARSPSGVAVQGGTRVDALLLLLSADDSLLPASLRAAVVTASESRELEPLANALRRQAGVSTDALVPLAAWPVLSQLMQLALEDDPTTMRAHAEQLAFVHFIARADDAMAHRALQQRFLRPFALRERFDPYLREFMVKRGWLDALLEATRAYPSTLELPAEATLLAVHRAAGPDNQALLRDILACERREALEDARHGEQRLMVVDIAEGDVDEVIFGPLTVAFAASRRPALRAAARDVFTRPNVAPQVRQPVLLDLIRASVERAQGPLAPAEAKDLEVFLAKSFGEEHRGVWERLSLYIENGSVDAETYNVAVTQLLENTRSLPPLWDFGRRLVRRFIVQEVVEYNEPLLRLLGHPTYGAEAAWQLVNGLGAAISRADAATLFLALWRAALPDPIERLSNDEWAIQSAADTLSAARHLAAHHPGLVSDLGQAAIEDLEERADEYQAARHLDPLEYDDVTPLIAWFRGELVPRIKH